MKGKLYGVGVGPGDPELITLKAKRVLDGADYVAVPKTTRDKSSQALTIAKGIIKENKEIIELIFPMSFDERILDESWNKAVSEVVQKLDKGKDVAFITLGDPTIYSTYIYLHKAVKGMGYQTEIIPGVTSFCASAARAGVSLGENRETIAVVPSAYECVELDSILDNFDNIALMKISRNLGKLKQKLAEKGLLNNAVIVSKCGLEDERIYSDINAMEEEGLSYFSTMIIKKGGCI
ncbi:MAG: precorrin-2 C(20)-methyltransferase [Bacillota bacterium]|nr:precorrin-2 C(20)-methyltransferase [Bacillota bacterium]